MFGAGGATGTREKVLECFEILVSGGASGTLRDCKAPAQDLNGDPLPVGGQDTC